MDHIAALRQLLQLPQDVGCLFCEGCRADYLDLTLTLYDRDLKGALYFLRIGIHPAKYVAHILGRNFDISFRYTHLISSVTIEIGLPLPAVSIT